jgi:hypothetical protein
LSAIPWKMDRFKIRKDRLARPIPARAWLVPLSGAFASRYFVLLLSSQSICTRYWLDRIRDNVNLLGLQSRPVDIPAVYGDIHAMQGT